MTAEPGDDPDLQLVRAVGDGDADAAAQLADRYLARLHAFAWRLLGDRSEAEDVVQEAFLRLWKHARRWQPGTARFSTWLFQVTGNLCRDRLRRRREQDDDALERLPDTGPAAWQLLQQEQRAAVVQQAIQQLPVRQREALQLCHFDGMGNIEAAEVMSVSVEAVESLLSRARRTLRERLAGVLDA